jgi:hypothetical protein
MELQNEAINIIELISQRLDPLFKRSNVHIKFRESDPSIFAEYLRYEKDGIQFKITACLHPHDYPYSLSIQFIDKNCSPWKYVNQGELLDLAQKLCAVHKSDLLIATDIQVQSTVEELYEIMKCILKNTFKNE